jgi:hypothetical protein
MQTPQESSDTQAPNFIVLNSKLRLLLQVVYADCFLLDLILFKFAVIAVPQILIFKFLAHSLVWIRVEVLFWPSLPLLLQLFLTCFQ